jgi:hypothetical protein
VNQTTSYYWGAVKSKKLLTFKIIISILTYLLIVQHPISVYDPFTLVYAGDDDDEDYLTFPEITLSLQDFYLTSKEVTCLDSASSEYEERTSEGICKKLVKALLLLGLSELKEPEKTCAGQQALKKHHAAEEKADKDARSKDAEEKGEVYSGGRKRPRNPDDEDEEGFLYDDWDEPRVAPRKKERSSSGSSSSLSGSGSSSSESGSIWERTLKSLTSEERRADNKADQLAVMDSFANALGSSFGTAFGDALNKKK